MSPDWTSGDLFNLREPMHKLWVTVSNIVYFIYAILLILIALGTMFGQDKFSYKVMLPKLALGILMVPFTWWFVQWTISIASVVTASVITIPSDTISTICKTNENDCQSYWLKKSIPKTIVIKEGSNTEPAKASDASKAPTETSNTNETGYCDKKENEDKCSSPQDVLTSSAGMYGYMMVYAYSIFKFQEVKQLNGTVDVIKA